jgi:hypothetical protein
MTESKSDPATAALAAAVAEYRKEKKRAAEIERQASEKLANKIRKAYAAGGGMKKADIIRAIDHEWSRTWVDRAIAGTPDAKG